MSQDDRRAAKTAVLSKVNQVLLDAGLNDTVWSIRDCDSTLFVLMYKKLVGKVSRPASAHSRTLQARRRAAPRRRKSTSPRVLPPYARVDT